MAIFARPDKSLLQCPSCGHKQEEAHSALSTFCRCCGGYYKIADGAALPAGPAPPFPFPMRKDRAHRVGRGSKALTGEFRPGHKEPSPRETQLEFFAGQDRALKTSAVTSTAPIPLVATSSGDHPALTRMARRLPPVPKTGHRHVHCLECDFPQSIPVGALSTMCLRCTAPIPLDHYELHTMHHRRIRTRGNVRLHRRGAIAGVAVQCNDLILEGLYAGSGIDCDGDLILLRDGAIAGPVRCRRLLVRDRVKVTFTDPVHAQEAFIDGIVRGDLICERKLHLDRKSVLEGDIQTRSLSISEGARHTGMVSMPQLEERYAKFGDLAELPGPPGPGTRRDHPIPEAPGVAAPHRAQQEIALLRAYSG